MKTYALNSEFIERFDLGWYKLKEWSGKSGRSLEFKQRTFTTLCNEGVSRKHLQKYLDCLADFVADKFNTRLDYKDMINGSDLDWLEVQAGSSDTKSRKNLRLYVSQTDPNHSPDRAGPSSNASVGESSEQMKEPSSESENFGTAQEPSVQNANQSVQIEVNNENNITLQVVNQPQHSFEHQSGSLPQTLLPSKPEDSRITWLAILSVSVFLFLVVVTVALGVMLTKKSNLPHENIADLRGMIYIENIPVQEGSVRILGTSRSDNIRIIDRSNPGYFAFTSDVDDDSEIEFRIDVDFPIDIPPTIARVPVIDGSLTRINLELEPKSPIFPRIRAKELARVNEDVPTLNRMAVMAYLGMDEEANRLAKEIQSRVAGMGPDEKYQYYVRRGFCHWQANEYMKAATYYSQAMDLRTDNFRHVTLAAESIRLSSAGQNYLDDLKTAVDWVDKCREVEGQRGGHNAFRIHLLNVTGARLAIAMGDIEHGKDVLLTTYPKMRNAKVVNLETLFAVCIDLLDALVLHGEFSLARTYAEEAKSLANQFPTGSKRALWAEKMANGFEAMLGIEFGQYDSVEGELSSAIEFVFQQYPENPELAYLFLAARARYYESQRKGELAIRDIRRCITWSKNQKEMSFVNERNVAIWRNRYARILIQYVEGTPSAGNGYSEALQCVQKSLTWAELQSPRDNRLLNIFRATKSNVLYMQDKLEEAHELINLAIDWGHSHAGSKALVFDWLAQRAAVLSYLARKSTPVDLAMLERADEDYSIDIQASRQSKNDDRELGILLSSRARIRQLLAYENEATRNAHLQSALSDVELSIDHFESIFGESSGNTYIYVGFEATILADIGRIAEAKELISEALKMFETSGSKSLAERNILRGFEVKVNSAH